jgi:hypothetical protein
MTGGRFNNCDPSQIAGVGYAGGRGEIVVSNGTLAVAGDMYLGGSFTNVFTTNPDKPFRNWPFGRHDAVGELTVAGGCVSVGKNLVLGADGTGRAVVCGGMLEVAGSLVCSNAAENAASGAELVFDLEGCESFSPLAVGGCLDVRNGARVVVRVGSGTCLTRPIALLRANGILGEIGDLDVGIDGAQAGVGKLEAYVKGGVLGVRLRKGLIIHVK